MAKQLAFATLCICGRVLPSSSDSFDCAWRKSAYKFGKCLLPRLGEFLVLHKALNISEACSTGPSLDTCFERLQNTLPNPRKPSFKKMLTSTREQCEIASLADPLSAGFSMEHGDPSRRCWIYHNVSALGNGSGFEDGDFYRKVVPLPEACKGIGNYNVKTHSIETKVSQTMQAIIIPSNALFC
jgi:hypothetical protein